MTIRTRLSSLFSSGHSFLRLFEQPSVPPDPFLRLARLGGGVLLLWPILVSAAIAQPSYPALDVAVVGGLASGSADTHGTVGATATLELNQRAAIEAAFLYLDRGPATYGLSLSGSLRVNLLTRGRVLPYVVGGAGVYRTAFDLDDPRYLGPINANVRVGSGYCTGMAGPMGPGFGAPSWAGTGTCPSGGAGYWAVGELPDFYARRLGPLTVPVDRQWGRRTFSDPAVTVGGGLTFRLTDHWSLRPDARGLIVFRNSHTHTVGVYSLSAGYRF